MLAEKLYQDLEVWYPYYRLKEAGYDVVLIAPDTEICHGKYGYPLQPDIAITEADPADFSGVIIPGGFAPDYLRRDSNMISFVRQLDADGKLVAAICHGGWMLASADIITDRAVTSFSGIKDDIVNAGGNFHDEAVVQDDNLITSRKPNDLPVFMPAILSFLDSRP